MASAFVCDFRVSHGLCDDSFLQNGVQEARIFALVIDSVAFIVCSLALSLRLLRYRKMASQEQIVIGCIPICFFCLLLHAFLLAELDLVWHPMVFEILWALCWTNATYVGFTVSFVFLEVILSSTKLQLKAIAPNRALITWGCTCAMLVAQITEAAVRTTYGSSVSVNLAFPSASFLILTIVCRIHGHKAVNLIKTASNAKQSEALNVALKQVKVMVFISFNCFSNFFTFFLVFAITHEYIFTYHQATVTFLVLTYAIGALGMMGYSGYLIYRLRQSKYVVPMTTGNTTTPGTAETSKHGHVQTSIHK
eukprot:GILK01008970.1.p1 GENE.GILK01008970.1~~GILK01008970.1.p1  ORF type:complete len:326 (+),score=39.91 GILK01008970.1:55-978(+)